MTRNKFKPLILGIMWILTIPVLVYGQMNPAAGPNPISSSTSAGQSDRIRTFSSPPVERRGLSGSGSGLTDSQGTQELYYNIHVLGEVLFPGTYKVLPSDRLSDGIRAAGGIESNGTQRFIQLRREGSVKTIDLFSYQSRGILSHNPYLIENDVIFVPLKKGEIQIEGAVNRPGNYEVLGTMSLGRAIELGGGFSTRRSHLEPIRVIRFNQQEKKEVIPIPPTEESLKREKIFVGDIIVVPHVLLVGKQFDYNIRQTPGDNVFYPTLVDNVYVTGAVQRPGPYPYQPSFDYQDYVGQAGPLQMARIKGAKVVRKDGKRLYGKERSRINAGDTIVVPSRAVTFNNVLNVFNTMTNTFLTTIALREVVRGL